MLPAADPTRGVVDDLFRRTGSFESADEPGFQGVGVVDLLEESRRLVVELNWVSKLRQRLGGGR